MSVELLQILSIIAFVLAGVFFLLCVALFFVLDVPKLYGEISGKAAQRAIENIQKQSESGTQNLKKVTERIKLTGKITETGDERSVTSDLGYGVNTQKTANEKAVIASSTSISNETTLLTSDAMANNETTLLISNASVNNETTVLRAEETYNETTLLVSEQQSTGSVQVAEVPNSQYVPVTLDVEMSFTGSSEIIE